LAERGPQIIGIAVRKVAGLKSGEKRGRCSGNREKGATDMYHDFAAAESIDAGIVDSKLAPNISHEMAELLRLFSNPRRLRRSKLRTSSQRATATDLQPDQNAICLPAPARFIRKSKQAEKLNDGKSAEGKSTRDESPFPLQQNKSSLTPLPESYDDHLLQTLMNCCELDHDRCPSDASVVSYLDAQLNETK
jgi:hypothetical protein